MVSKLLSSTQIMDVSAAGRLKEAEGISKRWQCSIHFYLIACISFKSAANLNQGEILQCRDTPKWTWILLFNTKERGGGERRKRLPKSLKWDSGLCWILVL